MRLSSATDEHGADSTTWPVLMLAVTMFLVPAVGSPSVLLLQDTLKSAMVAFGVLAAAVLFFWQQRHRTKPLLWHGLVALPVALMVYALGSMAWSHTYLAAVEAIRWFLVALLLWLGLNTLNRNNLPTLLWGIHGGAVVASVWVALQFWFDVSWFPQGPNPASTFINRNFFAEYAVSVLPFSIYLLTGLRSSRRLGWVAASVALIVVAIMMTGTRSALFALLILAPVFTVILFRYRHQLAVADWSPRSKAWVGLILLAGVVGMGSVPSGNAKILKEGIGTTALERSVLRVASMGKKTEYTEGSFSLRSILWKATGRMILANPLRGVGAGAWEVQIPLYQRAGDFQETDYYAHNEILQLLSEYGVVVGGLFLAVLFAYLLLAAGKTWHLKAGDLTEGPLRAATLASLLALLVVSNSGFPWRLASTGALMALCLAILASSDARLGIREAFFAKPLPWRPVASRALMVVLMGCAVLAAHITLQAVTVERKIVGALVQAAQVAEARPPVPPLTAAQSARMLQDIREGVAINPHYRKLTSLMGDYLANMGDSANALWVWESVASSRPNVATVWFQIARSRAQLGHNQQAVDAVLRAQALRPETPGLRALEVLLLNRTGHGAQAAAMLSGYFDQGRYELALLDLGYVIGLQARNWPLALRALELRNQVWPVQAADTYFRMGSIYADPAVNDEARALAAFRAGLQAVPAEQRDNFRGQVPARYRALL